MEINPEIISIFFLQNKQTYMEKDMQHMCRKYYQSEREEDFEKKD